MSEMDDVALRAGRTLFGDRWSDDWLIWALKELAPTVSCWAYGHPRQPRPKLRFKDRPWRCDRCGTWWVTEHNTNYGNWDSGGSWRWKQVEVGR